MKGTLKRLLLVMALVGFAGCTMKPPASPGAQPSLAQSSLDRDTAPDVGADQLDQLVAGNQAFALDLYRYLAEREDGNLFLSPHSISAALAMTYAGARSETAAEMAETLHFALPQDQLHPAFNQLDWMLQEADVDEDDDDRAFRLSIVNALWGQHDYAFEDPFLDTLAENYGAGMRLLDFVADSEASRQTINGWVSDETEERIEDLIPAGGVDALTRLVLTNAIYFKAGWATPFEETATQDGTFRTGSGEEVTVPMMRNASERGYTAGAGYQVVELPYDGYTMSMVILLPDEGTFDAFEGTLDQATLDETLSNPQHQRVALTMPKFEMRSSFSLAEALADMGMPMAFSDDADFSGMDGTKDLFISKVFHQTFVSVDEEGTGAAGATAVVMTLKAMVQEEDPVEMTVDRPFIFAIRDMETGSLLFVGRVTDPS